MKSFTTSVVAQLGERQTEACRSPLSAGPPFKPGSWNLFLLAANMQQLIDISFYLSLLDFGMGYL